MNKDNVKDFMAGIQHEENAQKYCVWADGTWCELEYLEEYLTFMSDDYEITMKHPD